MKIEEFKIGDEFYSYTGLWRVTDIGTRVLVAIKLDHSDESSWCNGPPYALVETVWDEDSMEGIFTDKDLTVEELVMGRKL